MRALTVTSLSFSKLRTLVPFLGTFRGGRGAFFASASRRRRRIIVVLRQCVVSVDGATRVGPINDLSVSVS